jgi:hypothetical protein
MKMREEKPIGKVMFDISMSLDGLITGPDPHPSQPLGKGGERLHAWAFEGKAESVFCNIEHSRIHEDDEHE